MRKFKASLCQTCMTLSDIQADGDYKLIIADLGTGSYDMKLKVYKRSDQHPSDEGDTGKSQTVITCLATLKKSLADDDAISCLVLGTENKAIYVLDPEAFTVLATMELPSVPVFLSVNGLYDVEYRIVTSCRNGCVYTLKRGTSEAIVKHCIELKSQPVGMERINKNIYVGTMDQMLHCFTAKGKKLWTVKMPATILTLEAIDFKPKGFQGRCSCPEQPSAGSLFVKILKRSAKFEEQDLSAGPPAAQNTKLNVPKKTKLFVDQTLREREHAVAMHRTFQRDLYLLRLNVAREYAKALDNSMNPISSDPTEPLKLSAQIQGIGPTFKLTVNLQNTSLTQASSELIIAFEFDERLYSFRKKLIQVPMLVPGLNYIFDTFIDCLNDKGVSDNVKKGIGLHFVRVFKMKYQDREREEAV
nr:hypothetical protein BaRGS_007520 [Batillaria attramentaria]